jgi:hypothetical protein
VDAVVVVVGTAVDETQPLSCIKKFLTNRVSGVLTAEVFGELVCRLMSARFLFQSGLPSWG